MPAPELLRPGRLAELRWHHGEIVVLTGQISFFILPAASGCRRQGRGSHT